MNVVTPPNSYAMENTVLASMMQEVDELAEYGASKLTEDDFYNTNNKAIFKHVKAMADSAVSGINIVIVQEMIFTDIQFKGQDTFLIMSDIMSAQTSTSIETQCKMLRELTDSRFLLDLSYQIHKSVVDRISVDVIKSFVDDKILGMESESKRKTVHIKETIPDTIDVIHKSNPNSAGIKFGYRDLDEISGGMYPGEFIVIGARPGMGKTSFLMDVLLNAADQGAQSLIFSLEMKRELLTSRYVSRIGMVSNTRIRQSKLYKDDYPNIEKAFEKISELPIHINDQINMTAMEIRAEARRFKRKNPDLKLIVVDYLQLIETDSGLKKDPVLATSQKSKVLRDLAKELDVPVVAIAQLNRACENRPHPHKRPILQDLKGSGDIEQDANLILFLYRGSVYKEIVNDIPVRPEEFEVIGAKVREGALGTANLNFNGEYYLFEEPNGTDMGEHVNYYEKDNVHDFAEGL